ncbi:hypothetical protein M011DRAFT_464342 [Sporormia fimetaria CBS 119925]|uniref:Uncharacterized protein n=1 Tax=Sporormia fimetaria CBS 119925 TaxID=1340428 RepID=A0A6A6VL69_9PLEO|nr:hypothetical protein M011DRAFT_464342 [Sporormia fimetaria CBS 119925]
MKLSALITYLGAAALVTAESCTYWDSFGGGRTLKGRCTTRYGCANIGGFTVDNRCSGGSNNKCCLTHYNCNDSSSTCLNTFGDGASLCNQMGGRWLSGKCPGPSNVKCCEYPKPAGWRKRESGARSS